MEHCFEEGIAPLLISWCKNIREKKKYKSSLLSHLTQNRALPSSKFFIKAPAKYKPFKERKWLPPKYWLQPVTYSSIILN